MRALLKDKEDSTLIAIEVTEAVYDPEEQILYLRNADASYQVESIIAVNADTAIRELFDRGAIDLTFYVSSGVPFIMANNLVNGKVDYANCAFITETQASTLRKGFAKPGDVLLTHKATIGRTAIVDDEYETIILTPQVTYYRVKKGISNRYLKYYFDSSVFQKLFSNWAGAGSTRAYLGITAQRKLPIVLPPYDVQLKIAKCCGALDDKIYHNQQINDNLAA